MSLFAVPDDDDTDPLMPLHRVRLAELQAANPRAAIINERSARTVDELPVAFRHLGPAAVPALVYEVTKQRGYIVVPDTAVMIRGDQHQILTEATVVHPELTPAEAATYLQERDYQRIKRLVKEDEAVAAAGPDEIDAIRAQLVNGDQLAVTGLEPVVDDFVYANSLFRIIGAPGSLKSFVALDWAAHVANGIPWRGHAVKPGRVLYIAAEGSEGTGKRLAAWRATYGRSTAAVVVLPMPIQVDSSAWSALMVLARDEIKPVLIIGDTQRRLTSGIQEKDNTDMGRVVTRLDEMRIATGAAVGLVHHMTKDGMGGGSGGNAVEGAMQSEITVKKSGPAGSEIATVSSNRQKDDARAEDMELPTTVVELGLDERGRSITSLVFEPFDILAMPTPAKVPMRERIITALQNVSYAGVTKGDIKQMITGPTYHPSTFYAAFDKLLEDGTVGKIEGKERFRLWRPEDDAPPFVVVSNGLSNPDPAQGQNPSSPLVRGTF